MDRMTRGFHRIGLALAVPFALYAVFCFALWVLNKELGSNPGAFALASVTVTALVYGICRTAAWVVNGFRNYGPTG